MLYDSILVSALDVLFLTIAYVFSFVPTQFQSWTSSMVMARVGGYGCDAWTVFNEYSTFKQPMLMDSFMPFNSLMYNCDIVLLLILV